jgi:hypothetical protein
MVRTAGMPPGRSRGESIVPMPNPPRDKIWDLGHILPDAAGHTRWLVLAIGILIYLLLIGLADRLGVDAGTGKLCANRAAMAHAIDCSADRRR